MKIDGGCHCGAITYEAEVDPDKVALCHCTDCQSMSGSAFRVNVFVAADDLKFLTGEPAEYVKTAESGNQRAQGFCRDCGTGLYATGVGDARSIFAMRYGTIRQRDQLAPKKQVWTRSRQAWVPDFANLPAAEKQQ